MTRSLRAAGAVASLSITLVLAACNASTPSASPGASGAAASPAASAAASAEATAAASPSSGAEASAAPSSDPSLPFDISKIIAGLSNLDSYHETITVGGNPAFDAVVVTKPTLSRAMTISGGAKVVVIGDKAWLSNDGKTYQTMPQSMIEPLTAAFTPELLLGPFGGAAFVQGATDMGTEKKNGVDAKHYHIDATTPGASVASFPPGATVDVWIASEGYVVAVETKGFSGNQDVQLEVTQVNDPANKVEEPG